MKLTPILVALLLCFGCAHQPTDADDKAMMQQAMKQAEELSREIDAQHQRDEAMCEWPDADKRNHKGCDPWGTDDQTQRCFDEHKDTKLTGKDMLRIHLCD